MGCDGGSIPTRRELVKEKPKQVLPDATILILQQWFHCALSKEPLQAPIVSDGLGRLYNKEAVLSYLVNRQAYGDGDVICAHITSLKDVTTLTLHPNPSYHAASNSREESAVQTTTRTATLVSPFVCPITLKEMNGKQRFSYLTTCGCVFSEAGLKQVPDPNCPNCGKPYTSTDDVIPMNSIKEDEVSKLKDRMERIKAERTRMADERKAEKAAVAAANGGDTKEKRKRKKQTKGDEESTCKKLNSDNIVNVTLPGTLHAEIAKSAARLATGSQAIQSLYVKKNIDSNGVSTETYLTRGTFTRYSSFAS
ncbi:hypothetical protein SeLEV6574_g07458 [Synchytrium endobioticum]|uniref:Uncharacterized protein n=1 Tax=Synchytrium endobioticum TaxID=286115 RepID=A0A507CHH3_9FUNG|nr:hypothetical protein SeLEV6574_g07458 [Synchytrium endobioticum]